MIGWVDVIQRDPAIGTQSGAVPPADNLGRQRQGDGVVRPIGQLQLPGADIRAVQLLVVSGGLVNLPNVDRDLQPRGLQTAHARSRERCSEHQAQCESGNGPRNLKPSVDLAVVELVGMAAKPEPFGLDPDIQPFSLSRPQPKRVEVNRVE